MAERVAVTCSQGEVEGVIQKTISGRDVVAFLGIPFAKPPIGNLRFKDPVPPDPWTGTLMATTPPNSCLQIDKSHPKNISGSEDCLYLNVYIPKESSREQQDLKDVMVYIHGGGFQQGSANCHSPSYLLDQEDVVLVIINYRLGILGFLSLLDEHLPGNFGLNDQVMALKWVKKNIEYFGGDPNKVTVVGCSAGGASVHAHLLSPMSRGLFQKAIITSGVAFNPWMFDKRAKHKALTIAEALGCPTDDRRMLVKCLRERPAELVVSKAELFSFTPVIEPTSEAAFLDKSPEEVIRSGEAMDVPLLFSYMEDDAIFLSAEILSNASVVRGLEENWNDKLHLMKYYNLEGEAKRYVAESIRQYYLGDDKILENPAKFTQMYSDWAFIIGIEKAAKLHASYNENPVYAYIFSYTGGKRYSDNYDTTGIYKGGACHGDDLYYVLETSYLIKRDGDPKDDAMSKTMIELWMNFVRGAVHTEWKPVKSGLPHFTYLNIASPNIEENEIRTKNDNSVAEFWESMENYAKSQ